MSDITHRLEFYASAFAPEPAEVLHVPDGSVLGGWLADNIPDFDPEFDGVTYSITLDAQVHGRVIAQMVPKGSAISSILKPVFKLLGLAPTKPKPVQQREQGDEISLAAVQANLAKFGQPVRESFGRTKIYPDYLSPRRRYFENTDEHWAEMLLCVGVGEYEIPLSSITFGNTPVISMGEGAFAQVIPPGQPIPYPFNEWWYTAPEVGSTSTGDGGLPLETIFPATQDAPTGVYLLAGKSITPQGGHRIPADWVPGMFLTLEYYHSYSVSGSTLTGDFSGLNVTAGDRVALKGDYTGSWLVSSFSPASGGTSGTASVWSATEQPSLLYAETPAQFSVTVGPLTGTFTISQDFANQEVLVSALNSALATTALSGAAQFRSGLEIVGLQPYTGRRITVTDLSSASRMFGSISAANTATVIGQPATPGSPASLELAGFEFDVPTAFLSILKEGERFVITGASPTAVTVDRSPGSWIGWRTPITTQDIILRLSPDSATGGWSGPFTPVPGGETGTGFEVDIFLPGGLIHFDSKGRKYEITASGVIAWRYIGETSWREIPFSYTAATEDQVGLTYRVDVPNPGRFEIRVRRNPKLGWDNTMEDMQWFALRARMVGGLTSYPDFTTVAVRVKGSSALATAADEMLSVVATRILNGVPERRISKAVEYIARRTPVDSAKLDQLETIWGPRGDTFDHSFENTATVKQAVKTALAVGFSDFSMDDGVLTTVRDQAIPPAMMYAYWQTFSAQNTTQPISVAFEMISDDETDGIDVEYLDGRTWRVETVRCMRPGSLGLKIEKIQADGIINRDRAYRFGMRELMTIKTEREQIKTQAELSGLNCGYGQLVNFVNEVPGWSRSSVVKSLQGVILESADVLDWQEGAQHVVALRRDDGTLSAVLSVERVTDTRMQVVGSFGFTPTPYRTDLFFGIRERFATPAIMREVRPSGTDRVNLMAIAYNPEKYIYDDAEADN